MSPVGVQMTLIFEEGFKCAITTVQRPARLNKGKSYGKTG